MNAQSGPTSATTHQESSGASRVWTEASPPFEDWRAAVKAGDFARADALAKPLNSALGMEALEITRRLRSEWSLTRADMLKKLKVELPQHTPEMLEGALTRWTTLGTILSRKIDGETFYFRREPRALFLADDAARDLRIQAGRPVDRADRRVRTPGSVTDMVAALSATPTGSTVVEKVLPTRMGVDFTLTIKPSARNLKPGAKVRVWLPFPKAYHQQTNPTLVSSTPAHVALAPETAPQRTLYFEHVVSDPQKPITFKYSATYETSALTSAPRSTPSDSRPHTFGDKPTAADTAERPPHIRFTPRIREIVAEASRDNPDKVTLAKRLWDWVDDYAPWTPEQEYGLIPAIPEQVLAAKRGDCGAVSLTFITLCRAAGIPARWVSGWTSEPGSGGMHDWAEVYLPNLGWVPADVSYGKKTPPPETPANLTDRVRHFYFGSIDQHRFIVNSDFGRPFTPPFPSLRADTVDLQRGEVMIDDTPLWYDEFDYDAQFKNLDKP